MLAPVRIAGNFAANFDVLRFAAGTTAIASPTTVH
jgi:hypothetical protein